MTEPDLFADSAPLTTVEAAAQLRVSRHTVGEWVRCGHMRPIKKLPGANGGYLFTLAEVARIKRTPRPRKPRSDRGGRHQRRQSAA